MARRLGIDPLMAKSWQSRKNLVCSLVLRRATRIRSPRFASRFDSHCTDRVQICWWARPERSRWQRCGRKAREVRTSTSYPTVHLRFDIHASSLLGEIKPPLIASRQAHPPMPSSLEAPSSNGEAPDQKRRGQRKTTQPAASNRL